MTRVNTDIRGTSLAQCSSQKPSLLSVCISNLNISNRNFEVLFFLIILMDDTYICSLTISKSSLLNIQLNRFPI